MKAIQSATATALVLLAAAAAAGTGDTAAPPAEEVRVYGTKIPKRIEEITHSVTVVDESEIEQQAFTDVTEILRQQAGVEFKQAGGVGQFNYLKLRGLDADNVLVVLDGVKINTASRGDIRHLFSQLDPGTIESLEILRGPQATLYGANATAGVIVINTKSGSRGEGTVSVERGSLGWMKGALSLRDTTEAPGGQFLYAVNVSATDSDNVHEHEYFTDRTVQLKTAYEAERFSVALILFDVDNDFGYAELDETSSSVSSRAQHWAFQTPDPHQHSETGERVLSLIAGHRLSAALSQRLQLSQAENSYSIHDRDDGFLGVQVATVDGIVSGASAGDVLYIYDRKRGISTTPLIIDPAKNSDVKADYEDETRQLDYQLRYSNGRFNLLGGFDYQEQAARQSGTYGSADNDDRQRSLYANGDLRLLAEVLVLSLGLRLDDYQSWGREATGNAGLAWTFAPGTSLYANYGTSFKPATLSQLFNPSYGVQGLQPETGRTAELGLRHTAVDGRFSGEIAYWHTRIEDVIFFDYSIANPRRRSGFGQYNNGAEAQSAGVEVQARYSLSPVLLLTGNYSFTDSDVKTAAGWTPAVQVARRKGNVGLRYDDGKLAAGINAYYAGPRLRWRGDVEMEEYWRIDVSARMALSDSLSASVRVENLFDEDIEEGLGYEEPGTYTVVGVEYRFR